MTGRLDLEDIRALHTSGTRKQHEIPGLLVAAAREKLTGRLVLKDASVTRIIGYQAGSPVMVASNVVQERLGGRLLAAGTISVDDVARVDAMMESEGVQFGAAVIKLGIMTRDQLVAALNEHRRWLVEQCVRMSSAQVWHDPVGAVMGDPHGLRVLDAIERGIRGYGAALAESIQDQIQTSRFSVPTGDLELARDLGCSPALHQLLMSLGTAAHGFQDLVASTEDDEPEATVLTLVLTGLITPVAAETTTATAHDAARPGAVDLNAVDAFLSSIDESAKRPAPRAVPPPVVDVPPARTALDDRLFDPVPPPPPAPFEYTVRAAPSQVPGMNVSQVPGMNVSQVPGMGVSQVPGMGVSQVPGMGVSQVPGMGVSQVGLAGGVPQTGVPDSVYALVPREFLASVGRTDSKPSRLGLYIFLSVVLLLVGLGGGGAVVWLIAGRGVTISAPAAGVQQQAAAPTAETHREPLAPAEAAAPAPQEPPPAQQEQPPANAATTTPSAEQAAAEPESAQRPDTTAQAARAGKSQPRPTTKSTKTERRPEPPAKAASAATTPPARGGASKEEVAFRLGLANKLLQKRDFKKAIEVGQEILSMDPRNGQAYRTLGIAYSSLGAKAPACESYRRYLRFAPGAPDRAQIEGLLQSCQ